MKNVLLDEFGISKMSTLQEINETQLLIWLDINALLKFNFWWIFTSLKVIKLIITHVIPRIMPKHKLKTHQLGGIL